MTIFTFANNINSTLASPVSPSATSITLASTANLPTSIPAGTVLVITLNDVATKQNFEILYATARTGATLTVLRAQEGTAALSWLTGDYAYSPPTAGQQAGFGQLAGNNTWSGNNTFSEAVVTADLGFLVPNNIPYYLTSTSGAFSALYCSPANGVNVGSSTFPLFLQGASGGNVFGIGQTQQTVTRSYNTTYTNSTNAPIMASVSTSATAAGGSIGGYVNGVEFTNSTGYTSGVALCAWIIVPPGSTYGWLTTGSVSGSAVFTEIR